MDDLLPRLIAFSPQLLPQGLLDTEYDGQIKSLVQLLSKTPASRLTETVSGEDDLLDVLDPSINSIPYLYTLLALASNERGGISSSDRLWQKSLDFISVFDPVQIRYAGHEWRRLLESMGRVRSPNADLPLAIQAICTAMLRLDSTTSTFTSNHLMLVRLCLQAKAYHLAIPVLDNNIYHFPAQTFEKDFLGTEQLLVCSRHETSSGYITIGSGISEKLSYRDHLQYHLYGAMVYLAIKNWERALEFLEIVIISPAANVASMIQVEAYKKRVLVGLLQHGKPLPMPKTTNPHAAKQYKVLARVYDVVAEVFKAGDPQQLRAEIRAAQKIWQEDYNLGLVMQVFDAFQRFKIVQLGHTYAALSVPDIGRRLNDEQSHTETERFLQSLIASGHLNASIVPGDLSQPSILRFATSTVSGPRIRSEKKQYDDLVRQKARIFEMSKHIARTDHQLELTKEYIDWLRKSNRSKDSGGANGTDSQYPMIPLTQDDIGGDEDMMSDL